MTTLPNTITSNDVYIESIDSVVWSFDIDRVPGLIRRGYHTKTARVCGVKYTFPNDESAQEYLKGYIVIGGVKVGVESMDAGKSWTVLSRKCVV